MQLIYTAGVTSHWAMVAISLDNAMKNSKHLAFSLLYLRPQCLLPQVQNIGAVNIQI